MSGSSAVVFLTLVGIASLGSTSALAQNKGACDLIAQADVEAIVGAKLLPPKAVAPFRSLLEYADFQTGPPDSNCAYTNVDPAGPLPQNRVFVPVEIRYAATSDPNAVANTLKQIDERTNDTPTQIAGLGDAAYRTGGPANPSLFVFVDGTVRLMIGPSEIGFDKEVALARKILGNLGATGGSGTRAAPNHFPKPLVLSGAGRRGQALVKLLQRAEQDDVQAQLALAKLYRYGDLYARATWEPDWAAAGYWYNEAANRGSVEASYELGLMFRDGTGVAADPATSLNFLRKAAEAGYVPAMVPVSMAYAAAHTGVSQTRATYWAGQADQHGDPHGTYILAYEYSRGWLGGDEGYYYARAMELYRKAADHGVCVAFDGIADLYRNGHGVPRDASVAGQWHARGNDCRARQLDSLWDQTATLVTMSNATGIHGERVPPRPALGGSELTAAQGQFLTYMGAALALLVVGELSPTDPNAADTAPDLGQAMREMHEAVDQQLREQQLLRQLAGPNPGL